VEVEKVVVEPPPTLSRVSKDISKDDFSINSLESDDRVDGPCGGLAGFTHVDETHLSEITMLLRFL
jgi:hypothetical protein